MTNKKVLSFFMVGVLVGSILSGCGRKEVADDSFVATPKPEKTEETVIESDETDNETITGTIAIKANMPYVFSEGYAWVRTETSNQLAVVDTDGNIKFTLDNVSEGIKVSNIDAANGITYDPVEATPFYDGASAVSPSRELDAYGYAIYDVNGKLLASSEDGDDNTDLRLLGFHNGLYLIEKTNSGFDGNNNVVYWIDKNGNIKSDEIEVSMRLNRGALKFLDNGNVVNGAAGIIDGLYIDLYDNNIYSNMDVETIKRYMVQILGSEDVIPLCYYGGGGETYGYVGSVVGNLFYATEFASEYENLLGELSSGTLNGWYDKDFNLVVSIPDYPEGVEVVELGQFKDGYAPVELRGADGKYYYTLVDKSGNQVYEPVGGVENVAFLDGWSYYSENGFIFFIGSDTSGRTYYLIDKSGKLYDISDDISAFDGTLYTDMDYESYVISIAEGFKYVPDGSLLYRKLDGTSFDQATLGKDAVNVQFSQAYKK